MRGEIKRRRFLQALGTGGAALPFVPLLEREADAAEIPRRLVVFCTTTGMGGRYPYNWLPNQGPSGLEMTPMLAPLADPDPTKDLVRRCVFTQGVDLRSTLDGPNPGGHPLGMGNLLTGVPLLEGTQFQGGGDETSGWASGASVDQHVADQIGQDTAFRSLEIGVRTNIPPPSKGLHNTMSYRGASQPLDVDIDPQSVWNRLFSNFGASQAEKQAFTAEQQSVIDFVREDLNALNGKVSQADAHKIDAHLEAISEIEDRLYALFADCSPPDEPALYDPYDNDNYPIIGQLQMDLLVSALACDITRVGSIMWGRTANGVSFSWLGQTEDSHQLSHAPSGDAAAQDKLDAIGNWYTTQFAYFLGKLRDTPEGDGSMLDNTVVLWCTEVSTPNNHSHTNMPFVVAGGNYFDEGTLKVFNGEPHNKLLVSVCQSMGLDDDVFGTADYGSGPLAGLKA